MSIWKIKQHSSSNIFNTTNMLIKDLHFILTSWLGHTYRRHIFFRKWLPGSGMLPIVQCFPFQPVRQIHVPLSHWPLIPSQRGSQLRVSHKTPPHPSSHTQRWLWQYPFIQRRRHISKIYPVTTYQAKHHYQSMIKVCHFPQH